MFLWPIPPAVEVPAATGELDAAEPDAANAAAPVAPAAAPVAPDAAPVANHATADDADEPTDEEPAPPPAANKKWYMGDDLRYLLKVYNHYLSSAKQPAATRFARDHGVPYVHLKGLIEDPHYRPARPGTKPTGRVGLGPFQGVPGTGVSKNS